MELTAARVTAVLVAAGTKVAVERPSPRGWSYGVRAQDVSPGVVRVDHPRDVGSRWLESELSAWRLALLSVVPGWVVTYEEGALRVTAGGGT